MMNILNQIFIVSQDFELDGTVINKGEVYLNTGYCQLNNDNTSTIILNHREQGVNKRIYATQEILNKYFN